MIRIAALTAAVGVFGASVFYALDVVHRIRPHRLWESPAWAKPAEAPEQVGNTKLIGDDGAFVVEFDE